MVQIGWPVGAHQPSTSKYKCMREFMRPPEVFRDAAGNMVSGGSPGMTTCVELKGHDGPHVNNRGEMADKNALESVSEFHDKELDKMKREMAEMKLTQDKLLKDLAAQEVKEEKGKK